VAGPVTEDRQVSDQYSQGKRGRGEKVKRDKEDPRKYFSLVPFSLFAHFILLKVERLPLAMRPPPSEVADPS
jgi:hypothetical protein